MAIGILNESGFVNAMMKWLERSFAKTVRGAEGVIIALTTVTNLAVSVNDALERPVGWVGASIPPVSTRTPGSCAWR